MGACAWDQKLQPFQLSDGQRQVQEKPAPTITVCQVRDSNDNKRDSEVREADDW